MRARHATKHVVVMQALKQLDKNAQRAIRIPNNNIINQTKNRGKRPIHHWKLDFLGIQMGFYGIDSKLET